MSIAPVTAPPYGRRRRRRSVLIRPRPNPPKVERGWAGHPLPPPWTPGPVVRATFLPRSASPVLIQPARAVAGDVRGVHPRVTARSYPQRSMLDQLDEDLTPLQSPTLTELEEARAGAATARQIDLEWLPVLLNQGHWYKDHPASKAREQVCQDQSREPRRN